MKLPQIVAWFTAAVGAVLLVNFLWWHWELGLARYFDVDEFAHLHWAYQVFAGQRPYVDFFLYVPPGYQWFLAPLFLLGKGMGPLIAGRMLAFGVFAGLVGATMALFWYVRKSWVALVAGMFLAFLPLPFDKFLEVRPDTLAALLVLLGVIGEIRWMRSKKAVLGILSGLFYALSLIVLPKSLPAVAVALGVGLGFVKINKTYKSYLPVVAGFVAPLVTFGLWTLTLGNLSLVFYSLFKLPFEANSISQIFVMMPDLFFYPNSIFYGEPGYWSGLLVNHIIWVSGILVGIGRLLTPYIANGKKGLWEELLLSSIFIIQIIFYVMIVPLKHSQYLIPIAVWVAFFAADGVYLIWLNVRQQWGKSILFGVAMTLAGLYLYQINVSVEGPKLAWTNAAALTSLKRLYAETAPREYILDLDGRTLYYPNPYYACCVPFGQFAPFLSRQLPSLSETLEKTQTKYIWQGELMRVKTLLPIDQEYIEKYYQVSETGSELLVRKP